MTTPKPALNEAELARLRRLLERHQTDVVAHLCYDLLSSGSFQAYDEGEMPLDELKEMLGDLLTFGRLKGTDYLKRYLAALEKETIPTVRQVSVHSAIDVFFIATDPELERFAGAARMPLSWRSQGR